MRRKWTIAIWPDAGDKPRKITKIIGLNDGGFSVLAPYHNVRSGFLGKFPMELSIAGVPGRHKLTFQEAVGFTAEDRVKLSYHADGFAQFSGERPGRIISGRDLASGEPKGLGLMTHPLTQPIWSGPSIGVTVWGIDEFDELQEGEEALIFEPKHFYYRACTPAEANGWHLSIFVFPQHVVPPTQFSQGHESLDVACEGINGPLCSVVRMSVIHLRDEAVFLGLVVNAMVTSFPEASGWIIHGPGDYTDKRKGHVLTAFYPRNAIPTADRIALDRTTTNEPGEGE